MSSPAPSSAPSRAFWACQAVGFGLYWGLTVFQLGREPGFGTARMLVEPTVGVVIGVALTTALRRVLLRRRWLRARPLVLAGRLLLASVVLAALAVSAFLLMEIVGYGDRPSSIALLWLLSAVRWTLVFLVWSSLYAMYAAARERQRAELEALRLAHELSAAKLAGLQSQLNPHFLFNALNTVRALIRIDADAADDALLRVARILRYTLAVDAPLVPLSRELANARDYLALEQLRFEERLAVELDIADQVQDAYVPTMLLQALVENGVKHGIAKLPEGGVLRLRAHRVGSEVALEVESPCSPVAASSPGTGIGLANSAERLRLLFGDRGRLVLDRDTPGRVVARVWIPIAS